MRHEIEVAIARGLRCIPVLLPGGVLPASLAPYARIDFTSGDDTVLLGELNKFISAVGGRQISTGSDAGLPQEKSVLNTLKGLLGARVRTPAPITVPASPADQAVNPANAVQLCRDIIRGQAADLDTIVLLVKELKKQKEMGFARRLLARARVDYTLDPRADLRLWLGQQHALCTYKDPHLPDDRKFDQALRILNETDDLLITKNQETLGLAGAIHKYRWEAIGQLPDLEQSAVYYLRGYKLGPEGDFGYTSINAAYVLDVLANQAAAFAQKAGGVSEIAGQRRSLAREIRQHLTTVLPPLTVKPGNEFLATAWWFLVTVAEAFFGLENYASAGEWLDRAKTQAKADDWEFESTARQLASIARMPAGPNGLTQAAVEGTPAWQTLKSFLGNEATVQSAFIGRVGLALSGGGLRASLYHIGVLAKLAELDVLRHVEVLSCVSGGAIIGAHYYLELQNLLQSKADDEISREDYIAIVRRIERDFLAAVQRNIRTRVVANPITNVKMLLFPNYSRSERIAELYGKEFFRKVRDGKGDAPRCLRQLRVQPIGEPAFVPKNQNWRRRSKVPVLVLNATSLNTGHNWQFTATYMGEPPGAIDSEIDGNYRLRRMYYAEAPKGYGDMRLGRAVAASAGVPGLFDPITLKDLYPDTTLRLVDGGVHDNQGISALFEQGCSVFLVSDASGQMGTEDTPGNSSLSALLRSSSVMGARVRGAEYHDLEGRRRSSQLRGLMFIHLKKDLDSDPKNWIGCEDPVEASDEARPVFRRGGLTSYGIRKDVQTLIADIRTDLDSFHEVEAFALMTSGYRMTETEFARSIFGFPKVPPIAPDWRFLSIENLMKRSAGSEKAHERLKKLLSISGSNALKVWRLVPWLSWAGSILLAALVIWFVVFAFIGPKVELLTLRSAAVTLLAAGITALIGKWPVKAFQYRATIRRYLVGLGLCLAGWLVGGIHLLLFDRLYLSLGRADRLLAMRQAVSSRKDTS